MTCTDWTPSTGNPAKFSKLQLNSTNASFVVSPDKITKDYFLFLQEVTEIRTRKRHLYDKLIEISLIFFSIPFPLDTFHKPLTFKTTFFFSSYFVYLAKKDKPHGILHFIDLCKNFLYRYLYLSACIGAEDFMCKK